jgi:LysR family glycine cleavage system transcriptional activator
VAHRVLVEKDIAAGRLITPFAIDLSLDFACYVIAPGENLERPEIAAFQEWLLAEAPQSDTQPL